MVAAKPAVVAAVAMMPVVAAISAMMPAAAGLGQGAASVRSPPRARMPNAARSACRMGGVAFVSRGRGRIVREGTEHSSASLTRGIKNGAPIGHD